MSKVKFSEEQYSYLQEMLNNQGVGLRWSSCSSEGYEIQAVNRYVDLAHALPVEEGRLKIIAINEYYSRFSKS